MLLWKNKNRATVICSFRPPFPYPPGGQPTGRPLHKLQLIETHTQLLLVLLFIAPPTVTVVPWPIYISALGTVCCRPPLSCSHLRRFKCSHSEMTGWETERFSMVSNSSPHVYPIDLATVFVFSALLSLLPILSIQIFLFFLMSDRPVHLVSSISCICHKPPSTSQHTIWRQKTPILDGFDDFLEGLLQ